MDWAITIFLVFMLIAGNRIGDKRAREIQDVQKGIRHAYCMIIFNLTIIGVAFIVMFVH